MENTGKNNLELLSPAGSYEAFLAALNAGADAVYAAGNRFGARAYANNFNENELLRAIDICHLQGKKLYMTVNTLCKEKEIAEFVDFIIPFYREGLHGVIVQDIGIISIIREMFPDLPVHASTQMTITSYEGADYLKRLGISRIVPARELSLGEIREIYSRTGLEIESFIHGAMCYSYSGQCLFSSFLGGRSGNRGRCAQPCRQPYSYDCNDSKALRVMAQNSSKKTKHQKQPLRNNTGNARDDIYPLSMKDLCTIDIIPDIIEAGVCSFKIEGRMKQPQYVHKVTSVYRKYIDLYLDKGHEGYSVSDYDREILASAGYRSGFMDGYYKRHNGKCLITLKKPNYCADGENDERYYEPLNAVCASAKLISGQNAEIIFENQGKKTVFKSALVCDRAENRPLSEENIKKQLLKAADGCVRIGDDIIIETSGDVFMPVSALNELRRRALKYYENNLLQNYKRNTETFSKNINNVLCNKTKKPDGCVKKAERPFISVLCESYEQYVEAVNTALTDRIYIETALFERLCNDEYINGQNSISGKKVYLALPYIFREKTQLIIDNLLKKQDAFLKKYIKGFLIRNYEALNYCIRNYPQMPFICDFSLYSFNHAAAGHLLNAGAESLTLPLELNIYEMLERGCLDKSELVVYGRLPLMISAGCIVNTYGGCKKDKGENIYLRDRLGAVFPVIRECAFCYNRVLNSVPLNIITEKCVGERLNIESVRIMLSIENKKETRRILDLVSAFYGGLEIDLSKTANNTYTKGHLKKGVE